MRKGFAILLIALALGFAAVPRSGHAQSEEPTVYVIQKGDTLWGLSERFMKDSRYWPNLWARNPEHITNPHFIFPGQKLKFYGEWWRRVHPGRRFQGGRLYHLNLPEPAHSRRGRYRVRRSGARAWRQGR